MSEPDRPMPPAPPPRTPSWRLLADIRVAGPSDDRRAALGALGSVGTPPWGEGPALVAQYNWHPYARADRAAAGPAVAPLPDGEIATMTVRVIGISELNERDVGGFMEQFGDLLRTAIREAPRPAEAPRMGRTLPPQWQFVVNAQDRAFWQDVERTRLYAKEGLGFRQIAWLEHRVSRHHERIDPPLLDEARRHRAVGPVRGESSVRRSVKRITEALQLERFTGARRRRLDAPAAGAPTYACQAHGTDCPADCPTLNEWWATVEPTLPRAKTGKLRGETRRGAGPRTE